MAVWDDSRGAVQRDGAFRTRKHMHWFASKVQNVPNRVPPFLRVGLGASSSASSSTAGLGAGAGATSSQGASVSSLLNRNSSGGLLGAPLPGHHARVPPVGSLPVSSYSGLAGPAIPGGGAPHASGAAQNYPGATFSHSGLSAPASVFPVGGAGAASSTQHQQLSASQPHQHLSSTGAGGGTSVTTGLAVPMNNSLNARADSGTPPLPSDQSTMPLQGTMNNNTTEPHSINNTVLDPIGVSSLAGPTSSAGDNATEDLHATEEGLPPDSEEDFVGQRARELEEMERQLETMERELETLATKHNDMMMFEQRGGGGAGGSSSSFPGNNSGMAFSGDAGGDQDEAIWKLPLDAGTSGVSATSLNDTTGANAEQTAAPGAQASKSTWTVNKKADHLICLDLHRCLLYPIDESSLSLGLRAGSTSTKQPSCSACGARKCVNYGCGMCSVAFCDGCTRSYQFNPAPIEVADPEWKWYGGGRERIEVWKAVLDIIWFLIPVLHSVF